VRQGFLAAWEEGAREWKEFSASGKAGFHPLADAWGVFAPVGLPGESGVEPAPDAQIAQAYRTELGRVVDKEVAEKEKDLLARIKETKDSPRLVNSLGTLYARFGLFAKAEEQFRKILARQEYVPALLNMGNVAYLKKDAGRALDFFTRAYRQDPDNSSVLLGLMQVYRDVKNRAKLDETYARLARISPETATKYESLVKATDEGTRAGDAQERQVLAWED
jgi:tetratricopeptide (TPR) repeat protein